MILIELNRITLVAMICGFIAGSFNFALEHFLKKIRTEQQTVSLKKLINKFFYLSFTYSIINGATTFVLAIWDTSTTTAQLNRFSLAMAVFYGTMPIHDRFWSFVFSQLIKIKKISTQSMR
ncbi:hypothetical protein C7B62_09045 [Pleurocapsa sp. CCALA 161]|uniref:hypothetical protein n=1 Tax=Pleurocapsa sp. CCALA 161 TaxID=2107688 RepID=UPI000D07697A|nr:hypothetical protein [Pleurocapsa sp. CCALA 161]PSB10495.1 hypothetical protein C7B62_09045 [Pleurocapsa sp. CCALA 161]